GRRFALRVLDFMRSRLKAFQEETGHLYNLEATPAEGASFRLAQLDRQRFPEMKSLLRRGGDLSYTNSTQLPVDADADVLEVLDHQDELQTKYTGGTVLHVFLGEAVPDPQAVKRFVRRVTESYHLPYFTLTPSFAICPNHGYLAGEVASCPTCGADTEVYSRVVGYLQPVRQWNQGKQEEFARRTKYLLEPDR
ncbi:MAG TPA: anaerobic ribonucleoside-triphosphate reductase, partial [Candidatus Aminicenantes bacterium]|nr:anaerobic ribonucleoside-triphosphate reductase [Candidatus Aminicenantes bacterium]